MKLSMQIFANWLKNYQAEAQITSNRFEIEAVRLFSPEVTLNENTLYIGRLKDFFRNGNDRILCAHRNDVLLLHTTDLDGVLNCVLDGLILLICPLNRWTRGAYSASGSQMMTSSSDTKKALAISRLAAKDLPEPGVPRISPLGFLRDFLSTMIRLLESAFRP